MIQIKTETNILKYLYTCICSWQNVLVSELKQILQFVIAYLLKILTNNIGAFLTTEGSAND